MMLKFHICKEAYISTTYFRSSYKLILKYSRYRTFRITETSESIISITYDIIITY